MQFDHKDRIILFRQDGEGAIDRFADLLTLSGNSKNGFTIESSIEDDNSYDDYVLNSFGEIIVKRYENIFDAEQLYQAILEVTSDEFDRWENIDWSWDVIISNLESHHPKFAKELAQLIKEK